MVSVSLLLEQISLDVVVADTAGGVKEGDGLNRGTGAGVCGIVGGGVGKGELNVGVNLVDFGDEFVQVFH